LTMLAPRGLIVCHKGIVLGKFLISRSDDRQATRKMTLEHYQRGYANEL
jgi:hypothetical protein